MQNETKFEAEVSEEWDVDELQVVEPRPGPRRRAIFSVRFSAAELGIVESMARTLGKPVGEFIREAALASSQPGGGRAISLEDAIAEIRRASGSVTFPATPRETTVPKSRPQNPDSNTETMTVIRVLVPKTAKRRLRPRDHSRTTS